MCGRLVIASVNVVAEASPSPRQLLRQPSRGWTFITNHAQVLLAVAQQPDVRVREIAAAADITERYAYQMLRDLQDAVMSSDAVRAAATFIASTATWLSVTPSSRNSRSATFCG